MVELYTVKKNFCNVNFKILLNVNLDFIYKSNELNSCFNSYNCTVYVIFKAILKLKKGLT